MTLVLGFRVALVVGCLSGVLASGCTPSRVQQNSTPLFSKNETVIAFENIARRKWDNPIIADLDKDGLTDILVTDHAHQATIFWNNGDRFSAPQVLIKGDTHGVAVADYDKDGRIDIIVSQGGGGGKNPRLPVRFQVNSDRSMESLGVYEHFERSRGRAVKFIDTDNNGELDLVTSAFPLKTQTQGANFLYGKTSYHQFKFKDYLPFAKWLGYKLVVTDINNDNDADLIFYGGENMVAVMGQKAGEFTDESNNVFGELQHISDTSSISPFDYDNDGDFDLLLTRAKHQFTGQTYYDAEHKRFAFFARRNKMDYDDLLIEGDLQVENLQMAYPDFDVFIGQNKTPLSVPVADKNGHRDFTLTPEQAEGYPQDTSKNGLYIGYVGQGYWRIGGKTSSPTSAVIHNVMSSPKVSTPLNLPVKLLENIDGQYVDMTEKLGIDVTEETSSAVTADFNNDGWNDILIIRNGNSAQQFQQILYINKGGNSFEIEAVHSIFNTDLGSTGGGAEAFDYDNDGDLDVLYANQRGRWQLYQNNIISSSNTSLQGNTEHNFIVVDVGESPVANASPQNARVLVKACEQQYVRMVGASSAAFSQSLDTNLHFGLGDCSKVDSVIITWSNQEVLQRDRTALNDFVKVGQHSF